MGEGYAFGGPGLDRVPLERRDPAFVSRHRTASASGVIVVSDETVLVQAGPRLALVRAADFPPDVELHLLGLSSSGALFAVEHDHCPAALLPADAESVHLRRVGAELSAPEAAAAAHAVALLGWHRRSPHCPACGARSDPDEAGASRRCAVCGAQHFPRTDPAVIMLPRNARSCVLARNARHPARMWSTLAGFVEAGETLEQAVVREVREEGGLEVLATTYVGSQPWPFPASLMVGFGAEVAYGEICLEPDLAEARWFDRDELAELLSRERLEIPPPLSIAHHLIAAFLDEKSE